MSETEYLPSVDSVVTAAKILDEIIEPTPMTLNANLSEKYDAEVYLKREDLQIVRSYKIRGAYNKIRTVRSYKIRGAYNKIRTIPPDALKYGIVCASAGNHAQGVAFSCNKLHIMGSIYMPTTTPRQKIEQVKMFGKEYIDIVLTGDTFDAANKEAIEYARKSGKTFIPPFDDRRPGHHRSRNRETDEKASRLSFHPYRRRRTCIRSGSLHEIRFTADQNNRSRARRSSLHEKSH